MSNYKILFGLKILKSIIRNFTETFLVLYFLQLSESNIIPLGIYKLTGVITIFVIIFSFRNIAKTKKRIWLLRIGIVLNFVFFATIIILKEEIVNHIFLMGILYGLEEGFYFSTYNIIESDGVANKERSKFIGTTESFIAILSVILPIIFGSFIYTNGFIPSIIIVLILIIIKIVLSYIYQDNNVPKEEKTNLIEFANIAKKDKRIIQDYKTYLYNGLTFSEGPFTSIIMIYIIKIFSDSFSLGIFTSIFAILTCILGRIFAKYLNEDKVRRSN